MKTAGIIAFIGVLATAPLGAAAPSSAAADLFPAIRAGDSTALRKLLRNGADADTRDESGNTPLMAAALQADAAAVELLLKAGAEVNATNQAGATALMRAAVFEEKARLLLKRGANPNAKSALGNTALILAARQQGNSRTAKLLLDHGADANAANIFGATALMAAAAANDLAMARLLLDRGASADALPGMDGDGFIWGGGRTALMWAAFLGNEAMLKLLLDRGAKVDLFALAGSALSQAAWGGHPGAARLLLDAGAQVNHRDLVANYSPLHWAASSEHSDPALTELLLARGAEASAEGGQPVDNFLGAAKTPLELARKRGNTPIVRALLKAGAKDPSGPAPAMRAKTSERRAGGSAAEAIQRALPPLARTAEDSIPTFLRHASKQECISCHQQQLPLAAMSLAHSRQILTDRAAVDHQLALLRKDISSQAITTRDRQHTVQEMNLQATFHPESAIFHGYISLAFQLEREPASAATDAMIHQLSVLQHADGHWSWNLPRPPIQASDIGATALAIHTIRNYPIPARQRELSSRLRQARAWLAKARAETNEERAHQLLGLTWAGAGPGERKRMAGELLREQHADGGWGQLAGLESDAYATGQSLFALMEGGGMPSENPAVRQGINFLLSTQLADGTWHVRRRAHPFQPPMNSRFPHGADGWISSAGTSWAVMALALSLDPSQAPQARPMLAKSKDPATADLPAMADKDGPKVGFTQEIQPILERSCTACHSGERAKGGLALTDRAALLRGGARGEPVVVPGQPESSPLLRMVRDQVEDLEMPPLGKRAKFPALTVEEIGKLSGWIAQGAEWPPGTKLQAFEK